MNLQKWPAMVAYIVNLIMAAVVAFNFLPAATARGISVGVVALTSVVVALLIHPPALAAATGAFQTLVLALSSYWLHLNDHQIAAIVGIFGLITAVITHTLGTPQIAHQVGKTVTDMERAQASR